ncbi:hypothetical protein CUU66_04035 [Peribacillus deserti]|uniref:Uncharacterized protein n=1 Tax=Peribacillus deserti TaxID=673318 RepID=A0A2N5M9Z4_9BACI|nr:hypothetical protein CUU66_04035 [Peribacillus deserti]
MIAIYKDTIFGFIIVAMVIHFTKGLNILDSWILTDIVEFLLCFTLLIVVSLLIETITKRRT